MAKIVWDATGEKIFESGTKHCVLYPMENGAYTKGVAWNGITAITESPSGADATDLWADDQKYASMRAAEEFGATIEAYTYPDEWAKCDGSAEVATGVVIGQQTRTPFGLSYITSVGSDTIALGDAFKLHLIWNATASPSERAYQTINDSPDAITFSWELETTPVNVTGFKPTANMVIDSTKADATKLGTLMDMLYGTDAAGSSEGTDPAFPTPDQVIAMLS